MDGAPPPLSPPTPQVWLTGASLARLMPMHLALTGQGVVVSAGPTLQKMWPEAPLIGRAFFDLFQVRRPCGITSPASLMALAGKRLMLHPTAQPEDDMRGVAVPLDGGVLLNLSFGIGVVAAVRRHALKNADFAATDLAVELLYLAEAKDIITRELNSLNTRLSGAKIAAEEQAMTDTLTGLRNRRAADVALQMLVTGRRPFGLMHLDLDFFKAVNDTLGHAAGDHVLRCVADVLRNQTRACDIVARVGGDEFLLIFPDQCDAGLLTQIAERIIRQIRAPMVFEGMPCRVAASIGMVQTTAYAAPAVERMLHDVDEALYAAKRAGRGCAVMATPAG